MNSDFRDLLQQFAEGLTIQFIGKEDLMTVKHATGRSHDLANLAKLQMEWEQ